MVKKKYLWKKNKHSPLLIFAKDLSISFWNILNYN